MAQLETIEILDGLKQQKSRRHGNIMGISWDRLTDLIHVPLRLYISINHGDTGYLRIFYGDLLLR
jgi:hypothetical protein